MKTLIIFNYMVQKQAKVNEIKSMGLKVIKAIKIKNESDINYKKYGNAEVILFDTPGMEKSIGSKT